MSSVEFWFEFASTYSYPAAMRIERMAAQARVDVQWRAFLLGPSFRAQGWNDSPFNVYPEKGRYMWRDMERVCGKYELPFRRPSVFPRKGLLAARIACEYADAAWLPAFVRHVYLANFADDRDIADEKVIAELLERVNQPAALISEAQTPAAKQRLRRQTDAAQGRGVFGAPTVFVGDEMFWGNDRLEDALAFRQAHSG